MNQLGLEERNDAVAPTKPQNTSEDQWHNQWPQGSTKGENTTTGSSGQKGPGGARGTVYRYNIKCSVYLLEFVAMLAPKRSKQK